MKIWLTTLGLYFVICECIREEKSTPNIKNLASFETGSDKGSVSTRKEVSNGDFRQKDFFCHRRSFECVI